MRLSRSTSSPSSCSESFSLSASNSVCFSHDEDDTSQCEPQAHLFLSLDFITTHAHMWGAACGHGVRTWTRSPGLRTRSPTRTLSHGHLHRLSVTVAGNPDLKAGDGGLGTTQARLPRPHITSSLFRMYLPAQAAREHI